ncbi:MAG: hypothetical protein ABI692_00220 [Terracoccus sp.]
MDDHGWVARAEGCGIGERVWVPGSLPAGSLWVPEIGHVTAEPVSGGWLLREDASVASLEMARRPTVRLLVTSAGTTIEIALTERHADLVELLARYPLGLDAQALICAVAGATTAVTAVTVRAQMSRLRRNLGGLLERRPYRLTVPTTVRD